jgi:hypothetical protein
MESGEMLRGQRFLQDAGVSRISGFSISRGMGYSGLILLPVDTVKFLELISVKVLLLL